MKEYCLKSIEGQLKLSEHHLTIVRHKNERIIHYSQIIGIDIRIAGAYGKISFELKKTLEDTEKDSVNNKIQDTVFKKYIFTSDETTVGNYLSPSLSFERAYEPDFNTLKWYWEKYTSGIAPNFSQMKLTTVEEYTQKQKFQIDELRRQRRWENKRQERWLLLKNIIMMAIGLMGFAALISIITYQ